MPLIEVGSPAPAFTLRDQHGEPHALSDYRGRMVVIYFYPEDDTPLCTAQACQFRDHHSEFSKIGATVLGISPQGVDSHLAFADAHALPFTLLADEQNKAGAPKVCTLYGVWAQKNMYGKLVTGMLRTTYLIDQHGTVVKRWDRVKTPGHSTRVLDAVRALHRGEKLTVLGQPAKVARSKSSKKKTRTQGGQREYTGVNRSRAVKSMQRSSGARSRASKAGTRRK